MSRLILASQSHARRAMLTSAGVTFSVVAAGVDEAPIKSEMTAASSHPREIAIALAEHKAWAVAQQYPDDVILGCDQTLSLADGRMLDKPATLDGLRAQLGVLSDTTHQLHSAAVVIAKGAVTWHATDSVALTMRHLSSRFIEDYVGRATPDLLGCVGGYQIEAEGINLFERIEGNYHAILGLPLLPLLQYLRSQDMLLS